MGSWVSHFRFGLREIRSKFVPSMAERTDTLYAFNGCSLNNARGHVTNLREVVGYTLFYDGNIKNHVCVNRITPNIRNLGISNPYKLTEQ